MSKTTTQTESSQAANIVGGMKSIASFCADNDVSRSYVYTAHREGLLRFTKVGRATRIKIEDELAWRESLPVVEAA